MSDTAQTLIDHEFDILCRLADAKHPSGNARWLSLEDLAESILDTSPGPRCALKYTSECIWRLRNRGFVEDRRSKISGYRITEHGRRFLE